MTSHDPACPWKGDPHDCPLCRPEDAYVEDSETARLMRQRPGNTNRTVKGAGHYE